MKNSVKITLLFFSLLIALSSCMEEKFDVPTLVEPKFEGAATHTIKQLKALCTSALVEVTDSVIITGIVVGNDESGNIYKGLHIQDATGGIEIKLDKTSLYNTYKVGQRVFVKCKGMYLGTYGGVVQLGDTYNNAIGRMAEIKINSHLYLDGFPAATSVPAAREISSATALNDSMLNTLVVLKNVSFAEAGLVYAESQQTTQRTVTFADGTSLIAYNSGYADFQADLMPAGKGNITCVLSKYNSTWQILIRKKTDVTDFVAPIISESFGSSIGSFSTQSVSGTQVYAYDGVYKCMKVTGFESGTKYVNEDWLLSPVINLSNEAAAYVSFSHAAKYFSVAANEMTLWISTNYVDNVSTATWTQLTVPTYPTGADWNFVSSGKINLSAYLGQSNVRIAFKYTSSAATAATWEIKGFQVERN